MSIDTGDARGLDTAGAAGDPLAPRVADFYAAFAAGDAAAAAAAFAVDGLYAFPSNPDDETDPRALGEGDGLAAAIAADPTFGAPHRIRVAAHEGGECLLEGWVLGAGGEPSHSFVAACRLDEAGAIRRCITFRCAPTEDAAGTDIEDPGVDAAEQIGRYFHELELGDMEAAMQCFTEDCLYAHPPYGKGLPRVEFRGHAELKAGLDHRGTQPKRHFVPVSIQRGPHLLFEGHVWVDGTEDGRTESFMSSASLAPDGRVRRYLAYVCEPMVAPPVTGRA
ncbi:MAG: nuclear transport factor 2 family protein [Actinobacteria bacterium]|nr:nuclear transport factor 2 family protein [Actinomycetota bacterium]